MNRDEDTLNNNPLHSTFKETMPKTLTRREFLKLAAGATAATGLAPAVRSIVIEPFVRPPEELLPGQATWYAITCRQCPAGCGIIVRTINGRAKKIEGNPLHPLNRGKLCARGQAGLQALYNPDRLKNAVRQTGGGGAGPLPAHRGHPLGPGPGRLAGPLPPRPAKARGPSARRARLAQVRAGAVARGS